MMFVGAATRDITPTTAIPMAGYAWAGKVGRPVRERLFAKALYVNKDAEELAICFVDLHSASLRLLVETARFLKTHHFDVRRLIIAGTHTHTGPGLFYGNSFNDIFMQALRLDDFSRRLAITRGLALGIADAVLAARRSAEPGVIGYGVSKVFEVCRNRSLPAFPHLRRNEWRNGPAQGAPGDLSDEQLYIDPRVRCLVAFNEAKTKVIASFATFGCHATALGSAHQTYSRDWPGIAVDGTRDGHPDRPVIAFAPAALGDITPLPMDGGPQDQGWDLAGKVAARVQVGIEEATQDAHGNTSDRLSVRAAFWNPADGGKNFDIGFPVLGGAEDGRSGMTVFYEPIVNPFGPDRKLAALRCLPNPLQAQLRVSLGHVLHKVEIGPVTIATVPGEPTILAGWDLERSFGGPAMILGCANDYALYFTTPEEYDEQHYEGAATIYGRLSLNVLKQQYQAISNASWLALEHHPIWESDFQIDDGFLPELLEALEDITGIVHRTGGRVTILWIGRADRGPSVVEGRLPRPPLRVSTMPVPGKPGLSLCAAQYEVMDHTRLTVYC